MNILQCADFKYTAYKTGPFGSQVSVKSNEHINITQDTL